MNGDWFRSTPESEALLAEERLVLAATELVHEALETAGLNRKQLAELLGVRPTEVSQRLSGRRNLTLRTLARMLYVLGFQAELTMVPNWPSTHVSTPTVPYESKGVSGSDIRVSSIEIRVGSRRILSPDIHAWRGAALLSGVRVARPGTSSSGDVGRVPTESLRNYVVGV